MKSERELFEEYMKKTYPLAPLNKVYLNNDTYACLQADNMWRIWQAAKASVAEGFVLVPKNKSEAFSKKLNDYLDDAWRDGNGFDDGFVSVNEINHDKIWSLVIEAQEPSND